MNTRAVILHVSVCNASMASCKARPAALLSPLDRLSDEICENPGLAACVATYSQLKEGVRKVVRPSRAQRLQVVRYQPEHVLALMHRSLLRARKGSKQCTQIELRFAILSSRVPAATTAAGAQKAREKEVEPPTHMSGCYLPQGVRRALAFI